jgi:hypothetical protein
MWMALILLTLAFPFMTAATDRYLAKTIAVPADATQIISTKETYFYLEEGDSIRAVANEAGDLELIIGYEDIS